MGHSIAVERRPAGTSPAPTGPPSPTTLVLGLIGASVAVRLLLAGAIGLGVDESYAVSVARRFSLSYFDHPPLSFWLAGAFAKVTGSESPIVVRLPFVVLFAGTTWLMYRLTTLLFDARAGVYAVLLLNLSAVFSVSTGSWVLPDGPLMFFMVAAACCLAHALLGVDARPAHRAWWLLAGVCTGAALLSKYHGAFLVGGTVLFLLTDAEARRAARRRDPWIALAVAAVLASPVVVWNAQHGWVSLRFEAARAAPVAGLHLDSILKSIAGQAGYVLPWIWVPLLWVFIRALRSGPHQRRTWFLCCLAIGPIVVFTLAALSGDPGLPHWEAPGYLFLFPLLGTAVASRLARGDAATRRWLMAAAVLLPLLLAVAATQTATGWMTQAAPALFRRGDPTLEAVDWRDLPAGLRSRGMTGRPRLFVGAANWIDAGKISYALGPDVPVLCLCEMPHQFAFMDDQSRYLGQDALLIAHANVTNIESAYGDYFDGIQRVGTVPIARGGRPAFQLALYVAHGLKRPYP